MADSAEVVKEVQTPEKEVEKKEKKVVDVEAEEKNGDSSDTDKPKENGSENGEKETNGDSAEVVATKRKSAGGDAPDGTPAEGATPEKKAKISAEEESKEPELEARNGDSEVAA